MRLMLAGVTTAGATGVNAKIEGFTVGGKTGTAQKVNPVGRGYLKGAYISSFAGFFPVNNPKYVVYVVVDQPSKTSYYGSVIAAPVFSRIASYTARLEGLAPVLLSEKNLVPAPGFKVADGPKAKIGKKGIIKKTNVDRNLASENKKLKKNIEPEVEKSVITSAELTYRQNLSTMEQVPDLIDLSTREVLRRMSGLNVKVHIVGSGSVAETIPKAGEPMPEAGKLTIILK